MQNIKIKTIARIDVVAMAQFLTLALSASILPFFIHVQWITGPIMNAIFILALFLVGIRASLSICLIPSVIALSSGLIPIVLAPMVPFIMISNIIFVLCIDFFIKDRNQDFAMNYFWGALSASFLKFIFLFLSVNIINQLLIKKELSIKIAQIMGWTQFATALAGALLAFVILKWLKKI